MTDPNLTFAFASASLLAFIFIGEQQSAGAQILYVGDYLGGEIKTYNATTGAFISNFAAVTHPQGFCLSPDGSSLFVINNQSTIEQLSTSSGLMTAIYTVPGGVTSLTYGSDGYLYSTRYVTVGDSGPIERINPNNLSNEVQVASVTEGLGITTSASTGGSIYVSSFGGDDVTRLSLANGSVLATSPSLGGLGYGVTIGPNGLLYAVNDTGNGVRAYNATTLAFVNQFVTAGSGGLSNAADAIFGADGDLYVSSYNSASIKRYDGTTGAYLGDFIAPDSGGLQGPTFIAFSPGSTASAPEPGSLALMLSMAALPMFGVVRRRRSGRG